MRPTKTGQWIDALISAGPTDECVLWPFAKGAGGYGRVVWEGRYLRATHVVLEAAGHDRPGQRAEACHSCDTPLCVNPGHLRWDTHEANIRDMEVRGRRASARGTEQAAAIFTDEMVLDIRRRCAQGEAVTTLAKEYGVNKTTISVIVRGTAWKHVGGPLTTDGLRRVQPQAKLTAEKAAAIRAAVAAGAKQRDLARQHGVSEATISRVIHRASWAA